MSVPSNSDYPVWSLGFSSYGRKGESTEAMAKQRIRVVSPKRLRSALKNKNKIFALK